MPSEGLCTCQRRASDWRRRAPPPSRPPCCCAKRCTCTHFHECDSKCPSLFIPPHSRNQGARLSGTFYGSQANKGDAADYVSPNSSRRCPVCIPEQAELQEADLLALQRRCEEARAADQWKRSTQAAFFGPCGHCGTGRHFYHSNTAEMLRRHRNSFYRNAVDAEYMARRRRLQAELDARRDEIVEMQRAREELRIEAAFSDVRRPRRRSCVPRTRSLRRTHSADPSARAPLSTPSPPGMQPPPSPENDRKHSDAASPPSTQVKAESMPPPAPPPPSAHPRWESSRVRQRHAKRWGQRTASCEARCTDCHHISAHGRWHCGWIWCPFSVCDAQHHSPCHHVRLPTPPAECQAPAPPHGSEQTCRQTSPATGGDEASRNGKASATNIVSMMAAGKLEKSLECLERDAAAETLTHPPQPRTAGTAVDTGDGTVCSAGKGRLERERGRGASSRVRSHSASSTPLAAPLFGRKTFITDDIYRDLRARYMAEWEARGVVRRASIMSPSSSAPLPEQTQKWFTTGVDACTA